MIRNEPNTPKESFQRGVYIIKLQKMIGEMMTGDLRVLYELLMERKYTPTAEHLVEEIKNAN